MRKIALDMAKVLELYEAGETTEAIGVEMGCSRSTIDRALAAKKKLRKKKRVGALNPRWKGGRYVMSHGYVMVRIGPREYRAEHRLVMEQKLGRKLRAVEVVHHINEDRSDNRPENLEVYSSNAMHMSVHTKYSPEEIVRLYRGGLSMVRVAQEIGCSSSAVQAVLEKRGLTRDRKAAHASKVVG